MASSSAASSELITPTSSNAGRDEGSLFDTLSLLYHRFQDVNEETAFKAINEEFDFNAELLVDELQSALRDVPYNKFRETIRSSIKEKHSQEIDLLDEERVKALNGVASKVTLLKKELRGFIEDTLNKRLVSIEQDCLQTKLNFAQDRNNTLKRELEATNRRLEDMKRELHQQQQEAKKFKQELIDKDSLYQMATEVCRGRYECRLRSQENPKRPFNQAIINRRNQAVHRGNIAADRSRVIFMDSPSREQAIEDIVELYGLPEYESKTQGPVHFDIVNMFATLSLCSFFEDGSQTEKRMILNLYGHAWATATQILACSPDDRQSAIQQTDVALRHTHNQFKTITDRVVREHRRVVCSQMGRGGNGRVSRR